MSTHPALPEKRFQLRCLDQFEALTRMGKVAKDITDQWGSLSAAMAWSRVKLWGQKATEMAVSLWT